MEIPDLTQTSLTGLFTLLVIFAAIDTLVAVIVAVIAGNFSPEHLLDYIRTHVLLRVFPIGSLLVVGHGLAPVDVPAIPAASALGIASLVAYGIETLASLQTSFKDRTEPPTTDGPAG